MRVLVCGGRDYRKYDYLKTVLSALQVVEAPFSCIMHGAATGADTMAGTYAARHNILVEEYRADWKGHGTAAGPIRNKQMLEEGKPDLVVAFPGGSGTAHMVKIAKAAGVRVIEIKEGEEWHDNDTAIAEGKSSPK